MLEAQYTTYASKRYHLCKWKNSLKHTPNIPKAPYQQPVPKMCRQTVSPPTEREAIHLTGLHRKTLVQCKADGLIFTSEGIDYHLFLQMQQWGTRWWERGNCIKLERIVRMFVWFDSSAFNARERIPPSLPHMSCLSFVSTRCSGAWFRVWRNPRKLPTKPHGTLGLLD